MSTPTSTPSRTLTGTPTGDPGADPVTVLFAHPAADLYGSDRMLLESVAAVAGHGHRVVVTLPADGPLTGPLRAAGAEVTICPTLVLRKALLSPRGVPRLIGDTLRGTYAGVRLLRSHRPAVLMVNTLTVPLWPLLGRWARTAVVTHVHEAEHDLPLVVALALAAPLLAAHAVVVNSRATARVLTGPFPSTAGAAGLRGRPGTAVRQWLGDRLRARIRLIYNGVAGPPREQVVAPAADTPDPLRIVYVGRLSPRKGVAVAVRALAALRAQGRPATLELVGDVFAGYEWFRAELLELVGALGLADYVRFSGFLTPVWPAYARADVAVVPSLSTEPFGNVSVEAQLAQRPVVVAATQGLVETVLDGHTGLAVPPDDPAALAAALQRLAGNWPAAAAMGRAARADALDRFSPGRYRAAIADLVTEMHSRPATRPARRRSR